MIHGPYYDRYQGWKFVSLLYRWLWPCWLPGMRNDYISSLWLTDAIRISYRGCRLQLYVFVSLEVVAVLYALHVTWLLPLQVSHWSLTPCGDCTDRPYVIRAVMCNMPLLIRTIIEVSSWGPGRREVKLNIFQIRGLLWDMLTNICFQFHVQLNGYCHRKGTSSFDTAS